MKDTSTAKKLFEQLQEYNPMLLIAGRRKGNQTMKVKVSIQ